MVLAYAFCNVSVMPLRAEPAHRAEQVNEVLFGERVEILEVNEREWARVRLQWDEYEGWCRLGQLTQVLGKEYRKAPKYITGKNTDQLVFEHSTQWLPMGSDLFNLKRSRIIIYNQAGKFKGKRHAIKHLEANGDNLKAAVLHYTNAPYLWGGRTIAGIDCSGLTQMAYKLCGRVILRDASQQASTGNNVDFLQDAQCGDLAFFDNADGKIVHVGMLLDSQTIIHATEIAGRVVIDKIDQGGIISTALRRRTHNLRLVKRYI